MSYDISILMPAIRTHNWSKLYESLNLSCKKYKFELVLISPFDLPLSLQQKSNIKLIKDFGNPNRCTQIGLNHCEGKFVYISTDDAIFQENAIDHCIDFYNSKCNFNDCVNMTYLEGDAHDQLSEHYWIASFHNDCKLLGIPKHYKMSMQFLISLDYVKEKGGFDCRYEYSTYALHDFIFRLQADGGTVYHSPILATKCTWFEGVTVDHRPIHEAQTFFDYPKFKELYNSKEDVAKDRINIDFDNWKNTPDYWDRRFKGTKPNSYIDILRLNNS
jgi:hypothetical protein